MSYLCQYQKESNWGYTRLFVLALGPWNNMGKVVGRGLSPDVLFCTGKQLKIFIAWSISLPFGLLGMVVYYN